MSDLVGARIVCLFLDDLPIINGVLRNIFDVFDKEDKTARAKPELFRYRSIHYQARIRRDHVGPHYDNIKHLDFEIQARTILQDAWASVEHTLAYKGPRSIPNELKRDINALVGLFHVADKSFQHLRDEITRSEENAKELIEDRAEKVAAGHTGSDDDVPINRGTLKAFLRQLYPDREASDDLDYSGFVEELAAVHVVTISRLREILTDRALGEDAQRPLVAEQPFSLNKNGFYFTDVGIARQVLDATIEEYKLPAAGDEDDEDDEEPFAFMDD